MVRTGELQDVPFGNGLVLDDPIAFRLHTSKAPQIVSELAAADALKVHEICFRFGDLAQCLSAVRHAANMRRVRWRTDDAQFNARPGSHALAEAIRDQIGSDVS